METKEYRFEVEIHPDKSLVVPPHIREIILIDGDDRLHIVRMDKAPER